MSEIIKLNSIISKWWEDTMFIKEYHVNCTRCLEETGRVQNLYYDVLFSDHEINNNQTQAKFWFFPKNLFSVLNEFQNLDITIKLSDFQLRNDSQTLLYCIDKDYLASKIQLSTKRTRKPINKSIRHEVFKRDNYRCLECGASNKDTVLHIDHIVPVSQGGSDELSNLQTLCETCNLAKSNRAWVGGTDDGFN